MPLNSFQHSHRNPFNLFNPRLKKLQKIEISCSLIQIKRKNKDNGTVALLIEGASRVGKSYIVEEFAKNNLPHLTFFTTRIMKRKKV